MTRKRIAVVMGTRPESIKMAPIVKSLKRNATDLETVVVATAQHRQMLDQVLSLFEISPDVDLDLMQRNQSLSDLTIRVTKVMETTLREIRPDLLLIQGDTTTVFAAALAAFYQKIPVAHVEAGLRSHDIHNPFPEEVNRRLASVLTEIHFAPTPLAREKLLAEGVSEERIVVTGNTVVDSLGTLLNAPFMLEDTPLAGLPFDNHRLLLVTSHRRESWGEELRNICLALKKLVDRFPDLLVVYPVHMNPNVRQTVEEMLSAEKRIHLTGPLDYLTFLNLMRRAHVILTDSGGVQEEAPSLRKPLLVLRKLTERPEAFQAGLSRVVGTSTRAIIEQTSRLLSDRFKYHSMISGANPYGDGRAAERITEVLNRWSRGQYPLLEPNQEFRPKLRKVA